VSEAKGEARAVGRSAYERRAWADAFSALGKASAEGPLEADDVERFAVSAALTGHEDDAIESFGRLHQLRLDAGDEPGAARAAFWAAMRSFSLGEMARGSGWVVRAQRLVEGKECAECGYVRLPQVFRLTASGDYAGARAVAAEAAEIGVRHRDGDLRALGRSFEGRALIRAGKVSEGLVLLDDAMLSVTSGELSPVVTGVVYCGVIAACQHSYALDRAREWTAALSEWCEAQPQLVMFAGPCLIHRSEIMQLGGAWPEAMDEARRAAARLATTRDVEAGNAHYQEGELHRLRGALSEAEASYALASDRGRDPQPGLALLRMMQGRVDVAVATMRRVLAEARDALPRTRLLPAYVEIMLAASDLGAARQAADELRALAESLGMEVLGAMASHADGAVRVAEGDARGAIDPLRRAQNVWQRVGAPYLSARVRVVVARAFAALGDHDGAALEQSAAKKVFVELGAAPDLAVVGALASSAGPSSKQAPAHDLSVREIEVLRLVASGKTNKIIGRELFVAEKTVDRHVSNIFTKLDVSTRAAATAWAFKNGIVG
jgi:DNA-binding CsgD family transcriptional regulator